MRFFVVCVWLFIVLLAYMAGLASDGIEEEALAAALLGAIALGGLVLAVPTFYLTVKASKFGLPRLQRVLARYFDRRVQKALDKLRWYGFSTKTCQAAIICSLMVVGTIYIIDFYHVPLAAAAPLVISTLVITGGFGYRFGGPRLTPNRFMAHFYKPTFALCLIPIAQLLWAEVQAVLVK